MFGTLSPTYRCGYSADLTGGAGNLNGLVPFTSCTFTRAQCIERGMFSADVSGNVTARFGGLEFVPPSIVVRSYREKGSHVSTPIENQAVYSDYVPLVYGTAWYQPPIVFARNDGNLTRLEVLLGAGEISAVLKVVVNDIEVPAGTAGANMTATGWYNIVSTGTRNGKFNSDFADGNGAPLGDPYGSMAYMSIVVPNLINDGRSLPSIQVLIRGLKLSKYDSTGVPAGADDYTNNPAWVLLDVLRRTGWTLSEIDLPSFAAASQVCDAPIQTTDLNGNSTQIPRFQCNLVLTQARSASDIVRGIRNGSGLFLNLDPQGLLRVRVEDTLASQQPIKPEGSNSLASLNGGWPAYEFGDTSFSGIALNSNGQSSLRAYSRSSASTPNRFTTEFQDEFNEYQQDSLSLLSAEDKASTGQEISAALPALGMPNYDQATRVTYRFLSKSVNGNTYVEFATSVKSVEIAPGDIIALTYSKEGFSRQPFRVVRISPGMNYGRVTITAQIHDDAWYSATGGEGSGVVRQGNAHIGVPLPLLGSVLGSSGNSELGIVETVIVDADGTSSVQLSASFITPGIPSASAVSIPLVSLQALYASTGGTLPGGVTSYYAVSGVDGLGVEGGLSFTISATAPTGTNTNIVTLQNLSFSANTVTFNTYRGSTPSNMLRIASSVPVAAEFNDPGLTSQLQGPPDANFDHANFYWRFVLRPEQTANQHSANTIGESAAGMQVNEYRGAVARITGGAGSGQERTIIANTDSTLTVAPKWDIVPDDTSKFQIADVSWQFGATTSSSPATITVPNRTGAIVDISGRAANVQDDECAYGLSPLTTWKISGGSGSLLDQDVPGQPTFGLFAMGQGVIEVVGIGFADLTNTRGVAAGTLSVLYSDEVSPAPPIPLLAAIGDSDLIAVFTSAVAAQPGDVLQIESELLMVLQAVSGGTSLQVTRGGFKTTASAHAIGTLAYPLTRKTFVMPFPVDFFGTPACGSYSYRVVFPNVRIAAAEFFVTNSKGNSTVMQRAFTLVTDGGIRTLSGGQVSIQIEGLLAIQTAAAPPLIIDSPHSVRDLFANVGTAPTVSSINLQVTQNGQPYCSLSIPAGAAVSNVVDGATLPPLRAEDQIGLNVLSLPQTPDSIPGADLTVTIRL